MADGGGEDSAEAGGTVVSAVESDDPGLAGSVAGADRNEDGSFFSSFWSPAIVGPNILIYGITLQPRVSVADSLSEIYGKRCNLQIAATAKNFPDCFGFGESIEGASKLTTGT